MSSPPESRTHKLAVLQQDNGELAEDVVARSSHARTAARDRVDEESAASFPASDPPSDWAGEDDVPVGRGDERLVVSGPVAHVPERVRPDDPVPGTLPRSGTGHPGDAG